MGFAHLRDELEVHKQITKKIVMGDHLRESLDQASPADHNTSVINSLAPTS